MRPSSPRIRKALISVLTCGLCLGSLPPQAAGAERSAAARKLDRAEQVELLLNRFTFGPVASERADVQRLGVDGWLRQQLEPGRIDDSALEQRLDAYPALRMTQAERLQRYPEPATLRQMARTGALPSDPEQQAVVRAQVEFYQARQQKLKESKNEVGSTAAAAPTAGDMTASATSTGQGVGEASADTVLNTPPMSRAELDTLLATDPAERYRQILSLPLAGLVALRKAARGPLEVRLTAGMTPLQQETLLAMSGTNRMMNAEVQGSRLLRDIYSRRQVEAVMTDFWLNHFNVYSGKNGQEPSLLADYEKTVRLHALGRFEDLLVVTAQSPAMLIYLDNAQSTGPDSQAAGRQRANSKRSAGLNENYARELMELHTLGVNGGYTQRDVTEVAKVFTGWTLERPNDGGAFYFDPRRHQPGAKSVLGRTVAEGGEQEGYEVLHALATSPATARFVVTEMAQRFVSDTPPTGMIDRMAEKFLSTGGDIRQVLLAMVSSPEFFTTATVQAKLKTPLEYVSSAVRASGAEVGNPLPLVQSLQQLGMPLYGCQPPTGYKWDQATWLSSSALVNRMNFALALSTNRIGGANVDWTPVLQGGASLQPAAFGGQQTSADAELTQKERLLEAKLMQIPVSPQTRSAVLSQGNDDTAKQAAQQFAQSTGGRSLTEAEKDAQQQDRMDAMMAGKVKGLKGAAMPQRGPGAALAKAGLPPADREAAAMAGLLLGSPEFQRR